MANIFVDNFTDTEGTLLDAHTPDTGTSWTERDADGGTAEINADNEAESNGGLGDGNLYTAEVAYPSEDYEVTITIGNLDSGDDTTHCIARWTDNDNMLALRFSSSVFAIHKKVAGTWTTIANRGADAPKSDGDTVTLKIVGTTVELIKNSDTKASTTVSDSALATGKAGIAFGGGAVNRVASDDSAQQTVSLFEVNNLGAASVSVTPTTLALVTTGYAPTNCER